MSRPTRAGQVATITAGSIGGLAGGLLAASLTAPGLSVATTLLLVTTGFGTLVGVARALARCGYGPQIGSLIALILLNLPLLYPSWTRGCEGSIRAWAWSNVPGYHPDLLRAWLEATAVGLCLAVPILACFALNARPCAPEVRDSCL